MNPVLLQLTSGFLTRILFVLAAYYFLKGHNNPGGGFIAGLMVASAIMLNLLALGLAETRKRLPFSAINLIIYGMSTALLAGILPILFGQPFFTGMWLPEFSLPLIGVLHIGSPLLFDLGVFMCVIGFTVSVIFDLEKTE